MSIFSWFKRNESKKLSPEEWSQTERGKKFVTDIEQRKLKKEEWEKTVPPERKEQVKLFKIFFSLCFGIYLVALFYGFIKGFPLIVLGSEFIISIVSFVLFKIKPRKVKYPNCFMMPVIAIFCTSLIYVSLAVDIFGYWVKKPVLKNDNSIATPSENSKILSKDEFENLDYSKFLKDNDVLDSDELSEDYEEYRSNYGQ